ncbi:alpha-latrotoxin-Lg1a-like, partial [Microplitis demolitor]|uniref:alpha-latrotoxin-Lg1a-like n=1 Tax=Microplitis demolitor TaxID=69319 RepID=UPI00235B6692
MNVGNYPTPYNTMIAIIQGNSTIVKENINSFGLSYDPLWLDGYELLCIAIENKQFEIMEFLLEKNVPVNISNKNYHNTPLHLAVMNEDDKIVKILLDRGADINKENLFRINPLDLLMQETNEKILELFIDHISDTNIKDSVYIRLLIDLLDKNRTELVEKLLSKCLTININEAMSTINFLCKAAKKGYYRIVEKLLERGVDANVVDNTGYRSDTALYIACEKGYLGIVKLLLDNGAIDSLDTISNEDNQNLFYYPLHIAIAKEKYQIVKCLLEYGDKPDKLYLDNNEEYSALHLACEENNIEIVKLLVDKGADVNIKNSRGMMPIARAKFYHGKDIFNYLINDKNFKLDLNNFVSLLYDAISDEDVDKVKLILQHLDANLYLKHKIDINTLRNSEGISIVYINSIIGDDGIDEIMNLFVEYGVDVNAKNKSGRTLLHVAFRYRKAASIVALLKNGADINATCNNGYTCLDYALDKKLFKNRYCDHDVESGLWQVAPDKRREIVDEFMEHIIKMKFLNLYVSEKNTKHFINLSKKPVRHSKRYKKEVENMKREMIADNISYYDFVTADSYRLMMYLNKDKIFETLRSESYASKFPLYAIIISGCFKKGLTRKKLFNEAFEYSVFNIIRSLPYPCMRLIMDYFSNTDLRELITKCKY